MLCQFPTRPLRDELVAFALQLPFLPGQRFHLGNDRRGRLLIIELRQPTGKVPGQPTGFG
jgi:hypothetical protein